MGVYVRQEMGWVWGGSPFNHIHIYLYMGHVFGLVPIPIFIYIQDKFIAGRVMFKMGWVGLVLL